MSNPKPDKSPGDQPRHWVDALEEQRLAGILVRQLLVDSDEVELAAPRPGDPLGPGHLVQRLRLRGLITNHQAQRLLSLLDEILGQGIPGYELIERVGQGSTAQVFKARQLGADRLVALKVMPNRPGRSEAEAEKFLALAKGWARLRHPRIMQVLDAGASPFPYCALEYVSVPSMDRDPRVVRRDKALTERELARIGLQIAEGLAYLHKSKVIHRDIKPANLFMLEDRSLLIGDLGLAQWGGVDPHRARAQGLALGSPYYMPPEQIANDPPLDGRADLYALGVTLFQLATGKVPYPGGNPDQVHQQHLEAPVPRVTDSRPDLSRAFGEMVSNLMAKDVGHRPVSAAAVVEMLARLEARAILGHFEKPVR